jgi:tetratricopeptide (TPR) repeat protein
MSITRIAYLATVLALWGCSVGRIPGAPSPSVAATSASVAAKPPVEQPPEPPARKVEWLAEFEGRLDRGSAHYRMARKALEAGDEVSYAGHLSQAQDEFIEAVRLQPTAGDPYIWMGIILAYQSDMQGALACFKTAHTLEPQRAQHFTNMAQAYVYLGEVERGRALLREARRHGAPSLWVDMTEILAAWREGDLAQARALFAHVYAEDPSVVQRWDEAAIATPIRSFDDFAAFCCSNPACGPHMAQACESLELEWKHRDVMLETLRKEYELERERRRRLKELQIEIEPSAPAAPEQRSPDRMR